MLSIAHATTGALIMTKTHPALGIPLTLAAHYLEDFIPHWDLGQGLTKKLKTKNAAFWQELLTDFPLSLILVYFFFQYQQPFSIWPWAGWFFGLLPDFLEFPYLFLGLRIWPIPSLAKFHARFHHSIPNFFLGLLPQLLLIAAIYLLR